MINLHTQTVNVNRQDLLVALRAGLEKHKAAYTEAVSDYQAAVLKFLGDALKRAKKGDFKDVVLKLTPPSDRSDDYVKVIEMLEMSVDENINLDAESFRAYVKNEWPWTRSFELAGTMYKTAAGLM